MSFVSFRFWVILPLVFILYWLIPSKYIRIRNLYLLGLSLFFYVLWKPVFALILLYIVVVTFFMSTYYNRFSSKRLYKWGGGIVNAYSASVF